MVVCARSIGCAGRDAASGYSIDPATRRGYIPVYANAVFENPILDNEDQLTPGWHADTLSFMQVECLKLLSPHSFYGQRLGPLADRIALFGRVTAGWVRCGVSLLLMISLSACVAPIPFNTVSLGGEPSITTEKNATLQLGTGTVGGSGRSILIFAGKTLVPVAGGMVPRSYFHAGDQAEFVEVLRSELLRLKVFQSVNIAPAQVIGSIGISVVFTDSYHVQAMQEFVLHVTMSLDGGKQPFFKRYRVVSSEKSSVWEQMNTNVYEGKVLAVRRLLERLVPDIQAYVAEPN